MKIQFIWYWNRAEEIYPLWRDGLRAALEEINKTHRVEWILGEKQPTNDADFILFWGDSNCPLFNTIDQYKTKKGIILTTDPHNISNLAKLDVVFCESTPVYEAVRARGLRAIKAFGTDTDFFKPTKREKDIEYFYPATFSPWKRQRDIAHLGEKLFCVGTLQPDGEDDFRACKEHHVHTACDYYPVKQIREYYDRSRHVVIPAIHGSERTVLEAMSMNIIPKVNPENVRTISYVKEFMTSKYYTPREFVVVNYSHNVYAKQLLRGIEE